MALVPVDTGAVNEKVAALLPAVALTLVGAPGLAVVTVNTVLADPQVMVAVPAVLPAITVVPLIRATAMLLLVQAPSTAPMGIALMVAVPPVATEAGVKVIPVSSGGVTVSTALTLPQVMVALPAVLPANTVAPLIRAMAMLLLVQAPNTAPVGTATMVEVPPVVTEPGVRVMPVSKAMGVTLLEMTEAALVPALLLAVTVQV